MNSSNGLFLVQKFYIPVTVRKIPILGNSSTDLVLLRKGSTWNYPAFIHHYQGRVWTPAPLLYTFRITAWRVLPLCSVFIPTSNGPFRTCSGLYQAFSTGFLLNSAVTNSAKPSPLTSGRADWNPGSTLHQSCGFSELSSPSQASVSPSVK